MKPLGIVEIPVLRMKEMPEEDETILSVLKYIMQEYGSSEILSIDCYRRGNAEYSEFVCDITIDSETTVCIIMHNDMDEGRFLKYIEPINEGPSHKHSVN